MWLEFVKVCPEIRELWKPDVRQEWVCPVCMSLYEKDALRSKCTTQCTQTGYWIDRIWLPLQPIPRLDQLEGMVQANYWEIHSIKNELSKTGRSVQFWNRREGAWSQGDSCAEVLLLGIAHEHGFELKEGKWVKR